MAVTVVIALNDCTWQKYQSFAMILQPEYPFQPTPFSTLQSPYPMARRTEYKPAGSAPAPVEDIRAVL